MSIATEQTNEACSGKQLRDLSSFSFRIDLSITPHGYKQTLKIFLFCNKHTKQDCTMGQLQIALAEILSRESQRHKI